MSKTDNITRMGMHSSVSRRGMFGFGAGALLMATVPAPAGAVEIERQVAEEAVIRALLRQWPAAKMQICRLDDAFLARAYIEERS